MPWMARRSGTVGLSLAQLGNLHLAMGDTGCIGRLVHLSYLQHVPGRDVPDRIRSAAPEQ